MQYIQYGTGISLATKSARKGLRAHDLAAGSPSQNCALEVQRRKLESVSQRKAHGRDCGRTTLRPEALPRTVRLECRDGNWNQSRNEKRTEGIAGAWPCGRKPFPELCAWSAETETGISLATKSARKGLRAHGLAAGSPSQNRALGVQRRNLNRR